MVQIEFLRAHAHGGREHATGSRIEVDEDSATLLAELGAARILEAQSEQSGPDAAEDLRAIEDPGETVTVGGVALAVRPIVVGQIPALMRALGPGLRAALSDEDGALAIDWLVLLERYSDNALDALAVAVGRERAWIDGLALDDVLRLTERVIAVNRDFFARRVRPALEELLGEVGRAGTGGPTSSADSSAPGTAATR